MLLLLGWSFDYVALRLGVLVVVTIAEMYVYGHELHFLPYLRSDI